ncbi:hypothetical protein JOF53_000085 [Crossiella equi]|uniref:DNA-binding protein n=1 Tax=Crossiella equi TaxID=130796 RepID=A0ABS5A3Q4_9PSEU|nr:DUF3140 domain-containing protein [Crossiella equi]MBP2471213.1 hypothetical protein [Crossiella equi]
MDGSERTQVREDFHQAVNMTAKQLQGWLDTEESKSVGDKSGGGEATGHASGRRIVDLLDTAADDLRDEDYAHMRKVVGYVHRHTAQRPRGNVADSRWRHSLMNWGHDPLKRS